MENGTRKTGGGTTCGRVLVLDSSRIVREALCQLLESLGFTVVVGAGGTEAEIFQEVLSKNPPDLLVASLASDAELEFCVPVIKRARDKLPGLKTVVLADCTRLGAIAAVTRAGADAVLSTDISADVLKRSLELVLLGQRLFPADIAQALLKPTAPAAAGQARGDLDGAAHAPAPDPNAAIGRRLGLLSNRERQILSCLVNGMSNKLIARALDITEATVKVHVKGVLRKTRLGNRTQAAIWALNNSIWDSPPPAQIAGPQPALPYVHAPLIRETGMQEEPARSEAAAATQRLASVSEDPGSPGMHGIPTSPPPTAGSDAIMPAFPRIVGRDARLDAP